MQIRLPRLISISMSDIVFWYAAFHGLAYYVVVFMLHSILPFDQGVFRFATNLLFVCLVAGFILKNGINRKNLSTPLPWAAKFIVLYFVWTGLSFLWTDSEGYVVKGFGVTMVYFAMWLNYLLEFLIVLLICYAVPIHQVAWSYLKGMRFGGFILAVFFLGVWLAGGQEGRLIPLTEEGRAFVLHHNAAAIKLATCALCSLHLYLGRPGRGGSELLMFSLFTFPIMVGLLLTIGKMATVGFILAFLIYMVFSDSAKANKLTALAIVIVGLWLMFPYVITPLQVYIENETYLTLTGRLELWQQTLGLVTENLIFGHGVSAPLPEMSWNKGTVGFTGEAHNEYLNALFKTGLIGLFILCGYYLLFFLKSWKDRKSKEHHLQNGVLGLSIFTLMFIFSFTASSPVGFSIPLELQLILILWMSHRWKPSAQAKTSVSEKPINYSQPDLA